MYRLIPNEYVGVLILVVVPLALLLIALLVWRVRRERTVARFPGFRIRVWGDREQTYVTYRDPKNEVELHAVVDDRLGHGRKIRIRLPDTITDAAISSFAQNLALGLDSLRFQYSVYGHDGKLISTNEPSQMPEV
jgi:hypothetical protein